MHKFLVLSCVLLAAPVFAQDPVVLPAIDAGVEVIDAGTGSSGFLLPAPPYGAGDVIVVEGTSDDIVTLARALYELFFVKKNYAAGIVGSFVLLLAFARRYGNRLPAPVGPFFDLPGIQFVLPTLTVSLLVVTVALMKGVAGWALVEVILGAIILGLFLTFPSLRDILKPASAPSASKPNE